MPPAELPEKNSISIAAENRGSPGCTFSPRHRTFLPDGKMDVTLPKLNDRSLPIGAELRVSGGVHFRVWAPRSKSVSVEFYRDTKCNRADRTVPLSPEPKGYFSGHISDAKVGDLYKLKLDHGSFPDTA